ncbi:MAG: PglZ domain-containing protein [Candidatus Aphodosoma sp.]
MYKILWVDDEIDLLKPYTLYLKNKGYEIDTATNGQDAIELCEKEIYDIVFLDENMPGLSGLETLSKIKEIRPNIPIVMITKSEEENIMDMAIGNKIADYLIKPVNPSQILMTLKKHIHKRDIINTQTTTSYRQEFMQIGSQLNNTVTYEDWYDLYKKLVYWDFKLTETDNELRDLLQSQKSEANAFFAKYIKNNYLDWINNPDERPLLSTDIFKKRIFPLLDKKEKIFFIVIDNFRYDQSKLLIELLSELYSVEKEELYFSILPTATQYARNAIFSGLMPLQIKNMFPEFWVDEEDEEGKNNNEEELIKTLFNRYRRNNTFSYNKIFNSVGCEKVIDQLNNLSGNDINICVINFIDMLSHARTDSKIVQELANTEAAYRSVTKSWLKYSSTFGLFKELARRGYKVVITTDHGTVFVDRPIKVVGDKNTNVNLRYKVGKALAYNKKEVFEINNPQKAMLPSPNISSTYIFATENNFFAYPNNYNYYVNYYKDTFQHGGVSMEEMLIPFITLTPKK